MTRLFELLLHVFIATTVTVGIVACWSLVAIALAALWEVRA